MLSCLKKYPLSILVCLAVIYLSFFKPPSTGLVKVSNLDKVVHFGMYFSMSALLWFEFFRRHRGNIPFVAAWGLAFAFPVLLSGSIELLQEYCTSYRGGDWFDFLANTLGAATASIIFYLILKRKVSGKPGK